MHGRRAKICKDEEVKLEKAKELIPLVNILLKKKSGKIYDKEYIETTSIILKKCPYLQTLWNYRREYFEYVKNMKLCEGDEKKDYNKNLLHELKTMMKNENVMVEEILNKFSKCNELWFHKLWIIKVCLKNNFIDISDLIKELEFCKNSFYKDDRNYHSWNYRSYIIACIQIYVKKIKHEKMKNEKNERNENNHVCKEFDNDFNIHESNYELSKMLIEKNFSNFSAWFLKYTICESLININNELNLIKNAIYTDPFDQSLWEFYRWFLFQRGNYKEKVFFILLEKNSIFFFFQNLVKLNISKSKCYDLNNEEVKGEWGKHFLIHNNPNNNFESYVYFFKVTDEFVGKNIFNNFNSSLKFCIYYYKYNIYEPGKIHYEKNVLQDLIVDHEYLSEEDKFEYNFNYEIDFSKFSKNENFKLLLDYDIQNSENIQIFSKSSCVNTFFSLYKYISYSNKLLNTAKHINLFSLNLELEQIDELLLLENNCKFALFTRFEILKRLERFEELFHLLKVLKEVDKIREGYYEDLETELRIQKKIYDYYENSEIVDNDELDLSGLNIDSIIYPLLMEAFFIPNINLSNNLISESCTGKFTVNFLYNLKELNLSHNKINCLVTLMKNLHNLKLLEKFDVSNNPLANIDEDMDNFTFVTLPQLKEINISDSNISLLLNQNYKHINEINKYNVVKNNNKVILSKQ
ncbi:protein prenyltransferase alpha subunit [Plasmodium gonderi]|uniref:Geranylgeranyl transferase type-2 subunit alpha n=1 Tax=Plasmodium gonderi TaxID=77519 RepID=A0A1Y1JJM6_PLAGO|nr:protein prenyltransferase alpha subunit [Plasmodium gonderi]GAW82661.1 protein prenyltransferase alpha subunit [Plasmodium gonderi]